MVFQQQLPLVGRDADLRLLDLVLDRAAVGTGSVALISGEAGIGKTRLCQELGRSQRDRGGQVLLGRAFPEETAISFGAIADALRAARRGEPPMWQAASARASVLWAIAPELAATPEVERRSFDRPVLFEALLDAVDEAAGDRVTLWVLEDLHWADEATWEFVRYVARRVAGMGLVLGVTYREEEFGAAHHWWGNLVRLQRDPSVVHVPLQRLSAADGERLVRALAPSLPQELVATILQRSAGTPLLVEELANLAVRSSSVPDLPDVVRATVGERAARLDPAARELLAVVAVAGLEVDQELLGSLRPEAPADALVGAGLLEREGARLRFRHPLLQEAAYQAIPSERRRTLHLELAEALARSGAHPAERIAGHLERAGRLSAALSVLESDAGVAGRAGNVGRAATLHLAALQLAGRHASLAPRRAGLEGAAIRELFLAGRWTELDPLVRRAWSRRDRLSLPERAWLANVLAVHLFWTGEVGEARALVERELAHLERHDALDQGAMLLAQAAFVAGFLGEDQQARQHTERALEIARRTGDAEAECRARYIQIYVLYALDRDRPAAIARARDTAAFAHAHGLTTSQATALYSMAEYTARVEDAEAARQAAERAGAWDYANLAQLLRGVFLLLQGQPDDAEAIFVRVSPEIRLSRPAAAAPWMDTSAVGLPIAPRRWDGWRGRRTAGRRPPSSWPARCSPGSAAGSSWSGGPCGCHCTSMRSSASADPPTPPPLSRRRPASASRRGSSPRRWPWPASGSSRHWSGPPRRRRYRSRRPGRGWARCLAAGAASCWRTGRRRRPRVRCSSGSAPTLASSGRSGSCDASVPPCRPAPARPVRCRPASSRWPGWWPRACPTPRSRGGCT